MKKIMISALVLSGTIAALCSFTPKRNVKSFTVTITAGNYGLLYHNKLTVFYDISGFTPRRENRSVSDTAHDTSICVLYNDSLCTHEIARFPWIFKSPIENGSFAMYDQENRFPAKYAYSKVFAKVIVHIRTGNQIFVGESPPEQILPNR